VERVEQTDLASELEKLRHPLYVVRVGQNVSSYFEPSLETGEDKWQINDQNLVILPEPILKLNNTWVDTDPIVHYMNENDILRGMGQMHFFYINRNSLNLKMDHKSGWDDLHLLYLKRC